MFSCPKIRIIQPHSLSTGCQTLSFLFLANARGALQISIRYRPHFVGCKTRNETASACKSEKCTFNVKLVLERQSDLKQADVCTFRVCLSRVCLSREGGSEQTKKVRGYIKYSRTSHKQTPTACKMTRETRTKKGQMPANQHNSTTPRQTKTNNLTTQKQPNKQTTADQTKLSSALRWPHSFRQRSESCPACQLPCRGTS